MRSHELGTGWLGKMERPHKLEPTCPVLPYQNRSDSIDTASEKEKKDFTP
jgi:hypothetical protein